MAHCGFIRFNKKIAIIYTFNTLIAPSFALQAFMLKTARAQLLGIYECIKNSLLHTQTEDKNNTITGKCTRRGHIAKTAISDV